VTPPLRERRRINAVARAAGTEPVPVEPAEPVPIGAET
jgi:hypothetical protein